MFNHRIQTLSSIFFNLIAFDIMWILSISDDIENCFAKQKKRKKKFKQLCRPEAINCCTFCAHHHSQTNHTHMCVTCIYFVWFQNLNYCVTWRQKVFDIEKRKKTSCLPISSPTAIQFYGDMHFFSGLSVFLSVRFCLVHFF